MKTRLVVACAPGLLSFFAFSCSSPDPCAGAQCAGGDGGAQDAARDATLHEDGATDAETDADSTVIPPGCNPSSDLATQAACVTEADGLFVDSVASAAAAKGTKAAPFATIQAAVNATSGARPNVFVCKGTYPEQVKLTNSANLYGGFDCGSWIDSKLAVTVKPGAPGYALQMTGVGSSTIEDMEFDAQDGVNPGDSSVAVFASGSTATFRRVKIVAGNAGSTPDAGAAGGNYTNGATAPTGFTADGGATGTKQTCPKCANGDVSQGGEGGGSGSTGGLPGGDGLPSLSPLPTGTTPPHDGLHGAGAPDTEDGCMDGHPGAFTQAASGGVGASVGGHVTATGWQLATGSTGSAAEVSQGGGGGGGGVGDATRGAGGGGGCGGCGGGGGGGAFSGGSSLGVVSFNSVLTFDTCTLVAGRAASGANGGDGQPGQTGGDKGIASGAGCPGGAGGNGGNGGGGGGGAGGLSIDVAYIGTPPAGLSTSMTMFATTPAAGGNAGMYGLADGGTGATGLTGASMELP